MRERETYEVDMFMFVLHPARLSRDLHRGGGGQKEEKKKDIGVQRYSILTNSIECIKTQVTSLSVVEIYYYLKLNPSPLAKVHCTRLKQGEEHLHKDGVENWRRSRGW